MAATTLALFLGLLFAAPSLAGFGDALPTNGCPSGNRYKTKLAVLDVTADGGVSCTTNAETAITCTVKQADRTGTTADFSIEFFDEATGLGISPPGIFQHCGVPVGSTVTFVTAGGLPSPWDTSAVVITPTASPFLHGSARVLSTGKVECSALRIDFSHHCSTLFPTIPLATKDLTIVKIPKQKGD
ncbi:MAG: hypothetical protein KatS3mg076_1516 [Candidatus Binatia bacterium]|nr:MAG: hypothetical protein KatS3mg076_1516 [Candidatus Binatia bacterium]